MKSVQRYMTVVLQIFLKGTLLIALIVSTKVTGPIKRGFYANVGKIYAFVTVYITIDTYMAALST